MKPGAVVPNCIYNRQALPASGEDSAKPPVAPTWVGMQSDGYLPPWEKNGTAPQRISAKSEDVLRPADGLPVPAITERDKNEVPAAETRETSKRVIRKRHRIARAVRGGADRQSRCAGEGSATVTSVGRACRLLVYNSF